MAAGLKPAGTPANLGAATQPSNHCDPIPLGVCAMRLAYALAAATFVLAIHGACAQDVGLGLTSKIATPTDPFVLHHKVPHSRRTRKHPGRDNRFRQSIDRMPHRFQVHREAGHLAPSHLVNVASPSLMPVHDHRRIGWDYVPRWWGVWDGARAANTRRTNSGGSWEAKRPHTDAVSRLYC